MKDPAVTIERCEVLAHPKRDPLFSPVSYVNLTAYLVPPVNVAPLYADKMGRLLIVGLELRSLAVPHIYVDDVLDGKLSEFEIEHLIATRFEFARCRVYEAWKLETHTI
jgi:hypothetical protein